MEIDWKRIEDHKIGLLRSCLITVKPGNLGAVNLAVAFKTQLGGWKMGNGQVCWFEPTHFAYLNNHRGKT